MLNIDSYQLKQISHLNELIDWYETNTKTGEQWIFRGLRDSRWGFESSLERAYKSFDLDSNKYPLINIEAGLIRRFIRQSQHYLSYLPEEGNILEWLSIMQHYGAPTRLLDWTHSLFVALFFAIEQASGECSIWALKHEWVTKTSENLLTENGLKAFRSDRNIQKKETFEQVFARAYPISLALPIKPYKLNDRLIIQQGTFLCPGDISKSFEDNLTAVLSKSIHPNNLIKLVIEDSAVLRRDILKNLNRMNMNAATLYPGLAGFAQSLRTMMIQPDVILP